MNQHQQGSTISDSYPKIGGWLIVPAVGLVLSPIFMLLFISSEILPVFTALPLYELSDQLQAYLLLDLALNVLFLLFTIVVAVMFFKRLRIVPTLIISLYLINLLFVLGDHFLFKSLNEAYWTFGIIQGAAACLIWIPYFILSKRVKATFIMGVGEQVGALPDISTMETTNERREIKVRTSSIRALLVGFVNWPVTGNEAEESAWLLTQEWNPLLADAMTKNPPTAKLGGFHESSIDALVAEAHKAGEQYPDCDLIIQSGGYRLMRKSTGKQENVNVLLLTAFKTEGDRRIVVVGGSFNLTLIPG